jgi:hypothetical protein
MNTRFIAAASILVLSTASQSVSAGADPECVATAGLRGGGTSDVIRVTNQNENGSLSLAAHLQVMDANGQPQGIEVSRPLTPNASVSLTVGQIFTEAGLKSFNANYLIQVIQHDATVPPIVDLGLQFQATYRNSTNGQILPLLFTCTQPPPG